MVCLWIISILDHLYFFGANAPLLGMCFFASVACIAEVCFFTEFLSAHLGLCRLAVSSMASIASSKASALYADKRAIGHGMGHVSSAVLVLKDFMLGMLIAVGAVSFHQFRFLHIVEKNQGCL